MSTRKTKQRRGRQSAESNGRVREGLLDEATWEQRPRKEVSEGMTMDIWEEGTASQSKWAEEG